MRVATRTPAVVAVFGIIFVVAAAAYFFGGFYNVSALASGNSAVEWTVRNVREASVSRHANAPSPPSWFSDSNTIAKGAHEFVEEGCVRCHGAPGRKPDMFARGMNPDPPDLGKVGEEDAPGKIFWAVKHGFRMTGMPGFGSHMPDEEIWRAVAFVKHMHEIKPDQFTAWTRGGEAGERGESGATKPAQAVTPSSAVSAPASAR